jgi:hypothetical protein
LRLTNFNKKHNFKFYWTLLFFCYVFWITRPIHNTACKQMLWLCTSTKLWSLKKKHLHKQAWKWKQQHKLVPYTGKLYNNISNEKSLKVYTIKFKKKLVWMERNEKTTFSECTLKKIYGYVFFWFGSTFVFVNKLFRYYSTAWYHLVLRLFRIKTKQIL